MAGAAKSCCQYDEAEQILRGISGRTRCFEDKLPSYLLLSQTNVRYTATVLSSLENAGQRRGC
eukprot:3479366-Ditylum_brightwellii.AAC.1